MTVALPEIPERIEKLKRDERGYPVPWFVPWIDGKPEFRCADAEKFELAIGGGRCWLCGERLDIELVFVIGPMCAVNRTTAEPPCHFDCARFAAKACPFLTMPKAQRRESNMPEESRDAAGFMIRRNPGCCLLWCCRDYTLAKVDNGYLIDLPFPDRVLAFSEGRRATRAEVFESIESGLPILQAVAEQEGPAAIKQLNRAHKSAMRLLYVSMAA